MLHLVVLNQLKDLIDVIQESDLHLSFALEVQYHKQVQDLVHLGVVILLHFDLIKEVRQNVDLLLGVR